MIFYNCVGLPWSQLSECLHATLLVKKTGNELLLLHLFFLCVFLEVESLAVKCSSLAGKKDMHVFLFSFFAMKKSSLSTA